MTRAPHKPHGFTLIELLVVLVIIGVLGALILAALTGTLSWKSFQTSLLQATETSCMLAFIIAGAAFTTVAMGFTGIPKSVAALIIEWQLTPGILIVALTVLYIILGCFLDGVSMIPEPGVGALTAIASLVLLLGRRYRKI